MRTIHMHEVKATHHIGEKWEVAVLKGGKEARITGRRGNTWENPIQCHVTVQNGTMFMRGDDVPQYVVNRTKTFIRNS
jgi:hypothetical protein